MKYLPPIFKQQNANPDHQSVIDAINNALNDVKTATDNLKAELNITTADSIWLDKWGDWFGVKRMPNETDSAFRQRILNTLTQDKLTIPALVNIVKSYLGQDTLVTVNEPYTQTFLLGHSKIGEAVLMDGNYYRVGVVDITVNKPLTDELVNILQLAKSAGTKLVVSYHAQDMVYSWLII